MLLQRCSRTRQSRRQPGRQRRPPVSVVVDTTNPVYGDEDCDGTNNTYELVILATAAAAAAASII